MKQGEKDNLITIARGEYAEGSDDQIEIDDDARISATGDGTGYWVQAWVFVASRDGDSAEQGEAP